MKQDTGKNRDILDKFYTKENTVKQCISLIKKYININFETDLVIEPSAGNGSFIQEIEKLSKNCKFYDIVPENDKIIKQDYLQLDTNTIKNVYNNIHIIGNPPFGRQSSLALKFIKFSTDFCNTLSFILPQSFKKQSLKNKLNLNFHLIVEKELDENNFLLNGKDYNVPCIFQIWIKKEEKRTIITKKKSVCFDFVKKEDTPDLSIRRVGINAGRIDTVIDDKNIQSHNFIKFKSEYNKEKYITIFQLQHFFNDIHFWILTGVLGL